jgi:hypothetical protein
VDNAPSSTANLSTATASDTTSSAAETTAVPAVDSAVSKSDDSNTSSTTEQSQSTKASTDDTGAQQQQALTQDPEIQATTSTVREQVPSVTHETKAPQTQQPDNTEATSQQPNESAAASSITTTLDALPTCEVKEPNNAAAGGDTNSPSTTPARAASPSNVQATPSTDDDDDDWEKKDEADLIDIESNKADADDEQQDWSNNNTSGKLMYKRDFLLQFQPLCKAPPKDLPAIAEIVLAYEQQSGGGSGGGGSGGGGSSGGGGGNAANNWKGTSGTRINQSGGGGGSSSGGNSGGGRVTRGPSRPGSPSAHNSPQLKRAISTSQERNQRQGGVQHQPNAGGGGGGGGSHGGKKKDGKLSRSKDPNVWSRAKSSNELDNILRKTTGLLNKITLETFGSISDQFLNLPITDATHLRGVIRIVFEKAVFEPHFASMYSELCRKLAEKFPSFGTDDDKQVYLWSSSHQTWHRSLSLSLSLVH